MTDLDTLTLRARRRRRVLDESQGEMRATLMRGKELKSEIEELGALVEDLDRVTLLLNSMGEDRQFETQSKIEELVTRGLRTIFDDTLSFHIVQTVKGRNVVVDFILRTTLERTVIDTPVLDARGGGVAATIGFLLRLVVMLLSKGTRSENILVLDETFAHVSAEYLPAVGEFLQEVKDKTGIQILMVTHQPELAEFADRVYRFSTEDGKTVISENA
ncbi:exonuclease [Microbacterium phage Magritte]|nr:exonuclease [Microbacterium phage Magritte]